MVGALVLTLRWCGANLILLLAAEAIAAFLGRPASATPAPGIGKKPVSLAPILQVVRSEPLSLRVEMAEVEVDLGTLASLRLGDVLRTSHRLDAPLMMTSAEPAGQQARPVICTGFLGREGDWRAIELLPHAKQS